MKIQVHTDNHIQGDETLNERVGESVLHHLGRYEDRITRIEVFLADENSRDKVREDDKRCVMEARLAGMKPISVRHHADTVREAYEHGAEKLLHMVEKTIGKLDHRHENVHHGAELIPE